jgi:hypothetical protein
MKTEKTNIRLFWLLGVALTTIGSELISISYFIIGSVPLTAVGISCLILGFTALALHNKIHALLAIVSLAIFLGVSDLILAVYRFNDIAIYFVVNAISFLIISILIPDTDYKQNKFLSAVNAIVFGIFLTVVTINIIKVLN